MATAPTILVFDSGLGGLTVFREVKAARPDARFVYLADDAGFPYGDLIEENLVERVTGVLGRAIADTKPDLVVVACNTASTLALTQLRARFSVPFVGTVPAIKPACARSVSKLVSVLGTQATVGREYTRALIREYASGCDVHLIGSPRLAPFAEAELAGCPGGRDGNRNGDRRLFHRKGWAAHRHDRACVYALSATAAAPSRQRAVARHLARSGAGDRSPCRGSDA